MARKMKRTTFIQRVYNLLPPLMAKTIKGCLLFFLSPRKFASWRVWNRSDEADKYRHILEGLNYLRVAGDKGRLPRTFFEFGCHSGRTFSAAINAARFLKMEGVEFHAFDSFEGLPDTDEEDGYFERGTFNTSESDFIKIVKRRTGLALEPEFVHKGFYADSLTRSLLRRLPRIGMVHVDVDLYSSTAALFDFIKPLLCDGTLVLFDDWYCYPKGTEGGEGLATRQFLEANTEFRLIPWKAYSTFGQSFFVEIVLEQSG